MNTFTELTETEQLRAIVKSLLSPSFGAQFISTESLDCVNMIYDLKIIEENEKIVLSLDEAPIN